MQRESVRIRFPALQNAAALGYAIAAYGLGVGLLIVNNAWLNGLGVLLLTHGLVVSAALLHELLHGNLFKARSLNQFWGQAMTHLNGACYAPWEDLVDHHFKHHVHHADFVAFDSAAAVRSLHPAIRGLFLALEWAYFPALEFVLRWRLIAIPFTDPKRRSQRGWAVLFILYRAAFFAALAWLSWKALLLYAVAYVSFVNLMRFADAFHHTYEYVVVGDSFPKRDRLYEQSNTFSNLVSQRYPWLNLLYLNFGYHNAHHHDMRCPWYALPALHQRLYGDQSKALIELPKLVANYHRFRLDRLVSDQGDTVLLDMASGAIAALTGGVGVSFLTPP